MNRLLGGLAGALMIAALGACSSGPVAYGGIQRINAEAKTVTLYNTMTFTVANADLTKFKVGDAVRIDYTVDDKVRPPKNNASSITPYVN